MGLNRAMDTKLPRPPAGLDPAGLAFFLDFDGVLAEIVPRPQDARLGPGVADTLGILQRRCGGALAIVSGRPIEELDRLVAPLRPALAGIHGLQMRGPDGKEKSVPIDTARLGDLIGEVRSFAAGRKGLQVETKPGSVAIHYRADPAQEDAVMAFAANREGEPGLRVLRGKMVVELAFGHRTKGDAVTDFLAQAPFAGRRPVVAGDDVTDEDGFAAVAGLDGISVKIGTGSTIARYGLDSPSDLREWLRDLADQSIGRAV